MGPCGKAEGVSHLSARTHKKVAGFTRLGDDGRQLVA